MKFFARFIFITAIIALMACSAFAGVSTLDDLKSAKVGVVRSSIAESLLRGIMIESQDKILTYNDLTTLFAGLKSGEVDAVVMDESPARFFMANETGLKILPETLESTYYGIAFKKGNTLRDDVNKALAELKEDGTLSTIISKYLHVDEPDPEAIEFNQGAEGGKLWVGCSAVFPPYEMRTDKGFAGIDIELCAAIAKKLNKELVVVDYRFSILPEALESGRIDMICSAFNITEEREKVMDFSEPYDADQQVILVLADK
ncbi:MAG: transporter substrate-binding domain-containing protein [Synergistaceae bacterium]|nr:transporter substrate-binding domain-containing protein [Synergistaceae bacterium]